MEKNSWPPVDANHHSCTVTEWKKDEAMRCSEKVKVEIEKSEV